MRPTTRHALQILGVTAVILGLWQVCLRGFGWEARFAESNYFANRIRMEEYLFRGAAPKHVLVGSSLSGRLLPEYFAGTTLSDFATLGLDGSIPLVGLDVLGRRPDLPTVVFVETYLVEKDWGANDRLLIEGLDSPGTTLARHVPMTRASRRPTSLLYSAVKLRKESGGGGLIETNAPGVWEPGPVMEVGIPAEALVAKWRERMQALKARGVRVVFVDLPGGEVRMPGPRRSPDLVDGLVTEFGAVRIDLRTEWFGRGWKPRYTDGRHLDAGSARATARLLAERVGKGM
jgi:hypothetical protein